MFLLSTLFLFGLLHIGLSNSAEYGDVHLHNYWKNVEWCRQLYNTVEDALVEENNLYILRESFFSSVRHPAEVLYVQYYIEFLSVHNGSNNSLASFSHYSGYSKYSIFSIVSPILIQALRSGMFDRLSNLLNIKLSPKAIILILHLSSKDKEKYSLDDIGKTLDLVTPRLKMYASVQGRLTTGLSNKNRGYMWDIDSHTIVALSLIIATLLLVIFTQCLLARGLFKFFKHGQMKKYVNTLTALFYTSGRIAMLWNGFELFLSIHALKEYNSDSTKYVFIRKFLIILGPFLTLASSGIAICCLSKSLPRLKSKVWTCYCLPKKMNYWFIFLNIFYFTYSLTVNIVPTVLLLFAEPLLIISMICFTFSNLFINLCCYTLLAQVTITFQRNCLNTFCSYGLYLLPCLAAIVIMTVYEGSLLASTNTDTNGLTQVAASVISAILAAGIGYITKRKIFKHARKSIDDREKGYSKDDTPSEESISTNKKWKLDTKQTGNVSKEEDLQENREDVHLLMEEQTMHD